MAKTKDRVSDAKPYVQRALKDEDLREDLKNAFAAAREVYDELLGGRGATRMATRVATDKEIQDNLRTAIDDLRSAANRLQGGGGPSKSRNGLLLAGIAIGILFNPMTGPDTRKWIKDKVFGEGDEFGYGGGGNSNK
jgi:hypothetical protein